MEQNKYHDFDVATHILKTVEAVPDAADIRIRIAALLHDVGKPLCLSVVEGQRHFYHHESASTRIAREWMTDMKFSNEDIDFVTHLVRQHMVGDYQDFGDPAVRRFIVRVGKENIDALLTLHLADKTGGHASGVSAQGLAELGKFCARIAKLSSGTVDMKSNRLQINGDAVMALLGLKPGKRIGEIIKACHEFVLDNPERNTVEDLKSFVSSLQI
jgi:poly(A) polymerase/tRNA nucleotidyltransferase (CCA-adding enzyme)